MQKKSARESNIELLRIVSMLLIILHHYSVHGPWPKDGILTTTIAVNFLSFGGKVGVCAFVIITGYFMSRSRFKAASILKLALETIFFSWVFLGVKATLNPGSLDFNSWKAALLPLSSNQYWFVTTYIVLALLAPLLNLCFKQISGNAKCKVILAGFILFSVIPTFVLTNSYTSNVVWFCYLYFIGAYIRERKENQELNSPSNNAIGWQKVALWPIHWAIKRPFVAFTVCLAVVLGSMVTINYAKAYCSFTTVEPTYLIGQNMIPTFLMAVALFCFFAKLKPFHSKAVNFLAQSAFGVYLIHDNPFVRAVIWKPFAPLYQMGGFRLIAVGIITAIVIYLACAVVDTIRRELLEKPIMAQIQKRCAKQLEAVDGFFNKLA